MEKISKNIFLSDLYGIEQLYSRAFNCAHDLSARQLDMTPFELVAQMELNTMVMDMIKKLVKRSGLMIKWDEEYHGDSVPYPAKVNFKQAVIDWNKATLHEGCHAVPQGEENEIPLATRSSLFKGVQA